MYFKQKRLKSLDRLRSIEDGTLIQVGAFGLDNAQLMRAGFPAESLPGSTILPSVVGAVTRRNAEGHYIIHKDRPKEKHYRMIEWSYTQWAGRDRVEVTESTHVPYERYPRTFVPPHAVEVTCALIDDATALLAPALRYISEDTELLLHTINLFLELFGECTVFGAGLKIPKVPKQIRLNWEVLPRGQYPWEVQKARLAPFISRAKGHNAPVIAKRLEHMNKHEPDFVAVGNAGFAGYVVYGFKARDLYVLESVQVNNATYILRHDWEHVSQLSKAEILSSDLHEARVIHHKGWYDAMTRVLTT